ncbi:MAG: septal ring lytic transglycosylase RlpA family protein [Caulobacter sp.]|nr:septal ring lytic transglycosylase RlpA family protein [Caulobacter sp.]
MAVAGHGTIRGLVIAVLSCATLAACASPRYAIDDGPGASRPPMSSSGRVPATMRPYEVRGVWYTPKEDPRYDEKGIASWYGEQFHNRNTANGEVFDMDRPSAAHKTLPLPSMVEVTDLDTGRKIRVRVNDRGPFVAGRIIDLSRAAAQQLGTDRKGVARVRVRYLGPAAPARK